MTWTKREAVTDLFILGDEDGQHRKVAGLIVAMPQDQGYKDKTNYRVATKNDGVVTVSGSATLARQLSEADIGRFVKMEFTGWGKSANGKYKVIDVNVYEGEPTPEMQKWPGYAEFVASRANGKAKAGGGKAAAASSDDFEEASGALQDGDDDLPF